MSKTKTRKQIPSFEHFEQLVSVFGWSIDRPAIAEFSASSEYSGPMLQQIDLWCSEPSDEETAAPGMMWRFVVVPYSQRKAFKNDGDVRALLYTLLTYRQDFLSMHAVPSRALELLRDNTAMNGGQTPFGAIYFDGESIWFGRKAGCRPALTGKDLVDAMRILLNAQ